MTLTVGTYRLIVSLLAIILIALGKNSDRDNHLLPAWFWDTPVIEGTSLSVGYSQPYIDSDHAYEDAFKDAAMRMFTDRMSCVRGERAIATVPDGVMQMGSTIHQETDTTGFGDFCKILVRLDSARTTTLRTMLVSTSHIEINKELIAPPGTAAEITTGSRTSVGLAPFYLLESSSWIEAERNGRIELAIGISSEMRIVDKKQDDQAIKTIVTKTDVILSNVQTLHRRIDRDTGLVKVWVGMK